MMATLRIAHEGQQQTLVCLHWRAFPPPGAASTDAVGDWRAKNLSNTEFQRLQVWQRICGLLKMTQDKCLTCSHARFLDTSDQGQPPMYVSPEGTKRSPALDIPTMSLQPTHREHLETLNRPPGTQGATRQAAWLEQAQYEDTLKAKD